MYSQESGTLISLSLLLSDSGPLLVLLASLLSSDPDLFYNKSLCALISFEHCHTTDRQALQGSLAQSVSTNEGGVVGVECFLFLSGFHTKSFKAESLGSLPSAVFSPTLFASNLGDGLISIIDSSIHARGIY